MVGGGGHDKITSSFRRAMSCLECSFNAETLFILLDNNYRDF